MLFDFFDTHAHYDDAKFDQDREKLLSDLPKQGISNVINAGACIKSSHASVKLAETYDYFYATVGVHPHNAAEVTDFEILRDLCKNKKVVAIGEIGLDYHYDHSPRDIQRHSFAKQLNLAKELNMPVVIHSREAAADTMAIIKESALKNGVLHCYSGHLPMALEYIEMGFYISISGVVTYKNAEKTREVAAGIPLDRLLIETDAPYLSPIRGKRNDSTNLHIIAEAIANARGIKKEEVAETSSQNARKLFLKGVL